MPRWDKVELVAKGVSLFSDRNNSFAMESEAWRFSQADLVTEAVACCLFCHMSFGEQHNRKPTALTDRSFRLNKQTKRPKPSGPPLLTRLPTVPPHPPASCPSRWSSAGPTSPVASSAPNPTRSLRGCWKRSATQTQTPATPATVRMATSRLALQVSRASRLCAGKAHGSGSRTLARGGPKAFASQAALVCDSLNPYPGP